MPPGDLAPVIVTIVFFLSAAATFILRGPLGKALARRLEGGPPQTQNALESDGRTAALEHRVAELEERADFAERLLAQVQAERPGLPRAPIEGVRT